MLKSLSQFSEMFSGRCGMVNVLSDLRCSDLTPLGDL